MWNLQSNFSNNPLAQENLMVGTWFWVLGNAGHYEAYLDLDAVFVMKLDVLNIKLGFGQARIFPQQAYVPLRLKFLASKYSLSLMRLEGENREENHPHIASKGNPGKLYVIQISL